MRGILRRLRRLAADQGGVAAIEFALIAPVFFALILSVIDISRYMWTLNTMQYAIDDAIRVGVVQELTDEDIVSRVTTALTPVSGTSAVTVDVVSDVNSVIVTATSNYQFFFPISSFVTGVAIDLRSEMPL